MTSKLFGDMILPISLNNFQSKYIIFSIVFVGVFDDVQAGLGHLLGFYRHLRGLKALQSRLVGWIKVSRPPCRQLFPPRPSATGSKSSYEGEARCCGHDVVGEPSLGYLLI